MKFPEMLSSDRLSISTELRAAALSNPRPGMAKWVGSLSCQEPADRAVVRHPVFRQDTPADVHKAFGDWPHLILETAPDLLMSTARELISRYLDDQRIPRVIVVPAGTDLRKYAEEREQLCGPGVVVVCMGSAELRGILLNCVGLKDV